MSKHAKLRVCASCEWIYEKVDPFKLCPKCNFASYGARYVYGNKCYKFAKNQKPWFDKKMLEYQIKLEAEIKNV